MITRKKPRPVVNFGLAFLFLSVVVVAGHIINLVITLLPTSQGAVLELGDGTTIVISSLRNSYLTLIIIAVVVYGGIWFGVFRSKNWARWSAVVLTVLAAVLAVQGLAQVVAMGLSDMIGLSLHLAQLIAAGWVLALAFRQEVHDWYSKKFQSTT